MSDAPRELAHRRLWVALGATLIAAVIASGLLPGGPPGAFPGSDKVAHALAYLVLMVWFSGLNPRRAWPWLALGLLAMGIAIELAQGAMHVGRTAEVRDVLANASGVALGAMLAAAGAAAWPYRLETWLSRN
jgi:hypothetical protein